MAITEDASSPAVVEVTGSGATVTASFTPPAGSIIVAMANGQWNASAGTIVLSDSTGKTWTQVQAQCSATDHGVSAVGWCYVPTSAAMTVTATYTNSSGRHLVVKVLQGANPIQAGQATATANISTSTTTHTLAITTTKNGSVVYGAGDGNGTGTGAWTPNGSTSTIDQFSNTTDSAHSWTFKATTATGTPGSVTLGGTVTTDEGAIALMEILPLVGTEFVSNFAALSRASRW